MKNKILVLNIIQIIVVMISTIALMLRWTVDQYAMYSYYILVCSYVGIFNLGTVSMIQLKYRTFKNKYSRKSIIYVMCIVTTVSLMSFIIFANIFKDITNIIFIVVIVYNNYYISTTLINLLEKFLLIKLIQLAEKIIFLFLILIISNIYVVILIDIFLKIIVLSISYVILLLNAKGKNIKFSSKDYFKGLSMMIGNWTLIFIMSFDKLQATLLPINDFGYYAMALSIFMLAQTIFLPIRMIFFTKKQTRGKTQENLNYLNIVSTLFSIILLVSTLFVLKLEIFEKYEESFKLLILLIPLIPIFLDISIVFINNMQITNLKKYIFLNLSFMLCLIWILNFEINSFINIIILKYLVIIFLHIFYSYIIQKKIYFRKYGYLAILMSISIWIYISV